ncbi:deoxyribonuclease gamma-like [Cyprinodon tularosa]|uniref:deoxyribonuclease gamma-like n=1 Tax=Cyprinodon tularosa TaxID=77115 RepID=UPI0018E22A29|nr:deoxyribonuclease gamma-like [Cyprinodon tularosa]
MFLYRDDLVDLVGSYQFDDEKTEGLDVFARDPYILGFRCLNTVLKDLVIIPVHTKPEDSDKELDKLYDVFVHVKKKWRTDFFFFFFARCGGPPWTGLIDAMKGVVMGEDGNLTLTLRKGNLLLERVKLNLEIQILRLRVAEMTRGNVVWPKDVRSI